MKIWCISLGFLSVLMCCGKNEEEPVVDSEPEKIDKSLPADLGPYQVDAGYHIPFYEGGSEGGYGYYLFVPKGYKESNRSYPLLLVMHGSGERGSSKNNPNELEKAVVHGPGRLVKEGRWAPPEDMIVVSAQTDKWAWYPQDVSSFLSFLKRTHKVDDKRVYLTGLSMGAYGIFDFLGEYGTDSGVAAAIPICGRGKLSDTYVANAASVPLWIFHGENDAEVPVARAHEIFAAINKLNPTVRPRMTLYPGVGHDSWTATYDGSGMGTENRNYSLFDQDIYKWMTQFKNTKK